MSMKLIPFIVSLFAGPPPGATQPSTAPAGTPPASSRPAATPPASSRPAAPPASAAADAVVDKVQRFYQATPQLSAKFRQTTLNVTFGVPKASDGRVYLKKPGKMRWDFFSKRQKNLVTKSQMSDGTTMWAVDKNGKWYYKENLAKSALPVAVTFLTGTGDLKAEFHAVLDKSGVYGSAGDKVLKLTPKKPSAQIRNLYLVVDPTNFRVKQSIVINEAGDLNHFRFYEPDTAKTVADAWFIFNPKAAKGFREIQPNQAPPPAPTP